MSATRIKLPFIRGIGETGAETAANLLRAAYAGKPMAPRGTRVGVHVATSTTDRGLLGILGLVLWALDGVAWADRSCVKAADVVIGEDECAPGWTDVWINREDEDG